MDEIVSNRVTLNEAVRKGTSPPLDGTTCDQLADYFVKVWSFSCEKFQFSISIFFTNFFSLNNHKSIKTTDNFYFLFCFFGENAIFST